MKNSAHSLFAAMVLASTALTLAGCNEHNSTAPSAPVVVRSVDLEAKPMSRKEIAALGIKVDSVSGGGAVVSRFETVLEFVAPSNSNDVLQLGDVITAFGETRIDSGVDLQRLLAAMPPGTTARMIVRRGDSYLEVAVRTGRAHSKDEPTAGSIEYV